MCDSFKCVLPDECDDEPLVDDALKAKAVEWQEKLTELSVEQDEETLIEYLERSEPDTKTLKKLLCRGTLTLSFAPVLTGTVFH